MPQLSEHPSQILNLVFLQQHNEGPDRSKAYPKRDFSESMRMKGPAIELRDLAHEPIVQIWTL